MCSDVGQTQAVLPAVNTDAILLSTHCDATVAAAVPNQRDRRSMSRRRGQRPRCRVVGDKYVGRYRVDIPGSTKQVKKAVIIGSIHEMTKPQADRKLVEYIEREGVNSAAHLERSRTPTVTFGEAARAWRDNHLKALKKPASRKSMGCELQKHVLPLLDQTPFEGANSYATIRALVRKWQDAGLSAKSIKNLFGIVRTVYNFHLDQMAERGNVTGAPWIVKWKKVKPVSDIEEEQACFEEETMFAVVNSAKAPRERAMYALFGGSGMRFGEVAALLVQDVRFVADGTGVVTVRRSLSDDEICTTKASRIRHVPIDATVVEELKKYLGARRSGLLFSSRNGTPLRENNMLRRIHSVLDKLKIPRAGFHAFRHGRCSFLVRSDVARSIIREWMGHASDAMIDRYSHRWGKHGKMEMQRLTPLMDSKWTQTRVEEGEEHAA